MTILETDICIIGGGSGGLSVAAGASQMGARVVLFERHKMGGDCLNYGCVPSQKHYWRRQNWLINLHRLRPWVSPPRHR